MSNLWTNQSAFTHICNHLRSISRRSFQSGMLAYRGDSGLKCAIGALIPDSEYEEHFDTASIPVSSLINDAKLPCLQELDYLLLIKLQNTTEVKASK